MATDNALLAKPLILGESTVKLMIKARERFTPELIDFLENDSDLIIECRVCRSLFRSLANFLAHKRSHCKERYVERNSEHRQLPREAESVLVEPQQAGEVERTFPQQQKNSPLVSLGRHREKQLKVKEKPNRDIHLIPIAGVDCAMEQKLDPEAASVLTGPSDVTGVGPSETSQSVVVVEPADGYANMSLRQRPSKPQFYDDFQESSSDSPTPSKSSTPSQMLVKRSDCDLKSLTCLKCNQMYSSLKTLSFHMVNIHSNQRKIFPCIYCKSLFSQFWGLTRHIQRAHSKSKQQIDEIRELLRAKAYTESTKDVASESADTASNGVEEDLMKGEAVQPIETSSKEPSETAEHTQTATVSEQATLPDDHSVAKVESVSKMADNVSVKAPLPLFVCNNCNKAFSKKSNLERHKENCRKSIEKATEETQSAALALSRPKRNIKPKKFHDDLGFYVPELVRIKQPDGSSVYKLKTDAEKAGTSKTKIKAKERNSRQSELFTRARDAKSVRVHVQGESVPLLDSEDEAKIDEMVDPKKLVCLQCKRQYGSCSNLRRHAVRHLGWRRFKCKLCKFTSYNKSECKSHLRKIHSSEVGTLLDAGLLNFVIDLGSLLEETEDGKGKAFTLSPVSISTKTALSDGVSISELSPASRTSVATRSTSREKNLGVDNLLEDKMIDESASANVVDHNANNAGSTQEHNIKTDLNLQIDQSTRSRSRLRTQTDPNFASEQNMCFADSTENSASKYAQNADGKLEVKIEAMLPEGHGIKRHSGQHEQSHSVLGATPLPSLGTEKSMVDSADELTTVLDRRRGMGRPHTLSDSGLSSLKLRGRQRKNPSFALQHVDQEGTSLHEYSNQDSSSTMGDSEMGSADSDDTDSVPLAKMLKIDRTNITRAELRRDHGSKSDSKLEGYISLLKKGHTLHEADSASL